MLDHRNDEQRETLIW